MSGDPPSGSSAGRRVAAIVVGLAVALALAEVALRVTGAGAPPVTTRLLENLDDASVRYHCYPSNPNDELSPLPDLTRGRWRLRRTSVPPVDVPLEHLEETPWCVEYRTGAVGVRGAAPSPAPAPGTLRIAGIGDSFAYGDGVPEDATLFAHLARELGRGDGAAVEVLNCAQSGADMALNVRTLEWVVGAYRPQRAIVVFVPNDVAFSDELRARRSDVFDLINVRGDDVGGGGLRVLQVIRAASAMRDVTDSTVALYRDAYDPAQNGANLGAFADELRSLAALSGGNAVLVLYPLMFGFEDGYPLQPVHDRVRAMAEEVGLPVFDLAPVFDGRDTESLWVHDADHHPNGSAHALAAKAVAAWLRADVPAFLDVR